MVRIKGDAEGTVPESWKTRFPAVALTSCLTMLHSFRIFIYKFITKPYHSSQSYQGFMGTSAKIPGSCVLEHTVKHLTHRNKSRDIRISGKDSLSREEVVRAGES